MSQRLSLLSMFDQLSRNAKVLELGIETDFERFVRHQDQWRQRVKNRDEEISKLKEYINELENRNRKLEKINLTNETKLRETRSQLEYEIRKRSHCEKQKEALEQQIQVIREILDKKQDKDSVAILEKCLLQSQVDSPRSVIMEESGSFLSDADISYDKTEEDLDVTFLRNGRKWKRSMTTDDDNNRVKKPRMVRCHRRSNSASIAVSINSANESNDHKRVRSQSPERKTMRKYNSDSRNENIQVPIGAPYLKKHNSGNLDRLHTFQQKTSLRPGQVCAGCGNRISFGKMILKCKDCGAISHDVCKDSVPLPCSQVLQTPGKSVKGELTSYAPRDPPFIPALIVHCVREIELRGLSEQGIYRVPGSEKEVRELKEKFFKGKGTPSMSNVGDINVVCGCIKSFFKDLKEPLITYELWSEFVKAAEACARGDGESGLYQAISKLPPVNRDTLAYLILHLQRVAESPETKMGVDNLSKVFGPTLVGCSDPNPEPTQMIKETNSSQHVVKALLLLPHDYWSRFVDVSPNVQLYPGTPGENGLEYMSMLGPVDSSDRVKRGWMNTPTPGPGKSGAKSYFASPVL